MSFLGLRLLLNLYQWIKNYFFTSKSTMAISEGTHYISASNIVLTGSINVTGANTNVPGTGTLFNTELSKGSTILVSGETRIIDTITNDTTATVTVAWGSDLADDTSPELVPYATLNAAEADMAATLTGNLTIQHMDEETSLSGSITFDLDTAGFLLKLTAFPGGLYGLSDARNDGAAYGSGARIVVGNGLNITYDEASAGTFDDLEISDLSFNASGNNSKPVVFTDGSDAGEWKIQRCLFKGSNIATNGINMAGSTVPNITVINNIIYEFTRAAAKGIRLANTGASSVVYIANNTVIGCTENFVQDNATLSGTVTFKNNLLQAGVTADYRDDRTSGSTITTGGNIDEDGSSPDTQQDVHTNSVFLNYGSDDYRLDSAGDATNLAIVDNGEDLSGTFTDDIQRQTRATWYSGASEIVVSGRIMSSLVNFGGLAGYGGIAGKGGGLAG
jgi:hypothetical protein